MKAGKLILLLKKLKAFCRVCFILEARYFIKSKNLCEIIRLGKVIAILLAAVLAVGAAFADSTSLPPAEQSALTIRFDVGNRLEVKYIFSHAGDRDGYSFYMGSADGKIKTGSADFTLVDKTYCNWNEEKSVWIQFVGPTRWKSSDPVCEGKKDVSFDPLALVDGVEGVTVDENADSSKHTLKVTYSKAECGKIPDYRKTTRDIAKLHLSWESEDVPAGIYYSTLTLTITVDSPPASNTAE